MDKIQIGIACGPNCEPYVDFLMHTVKHTVSDINKVEFLLGINKPTVNRDYLTKNNDIFNIKVIDAISEHFSSLGHGYCLDRVLEHMDAKYGMFVDCDVAFLEKDWDIKLINELQNNKVIVGAGTEKDHHHYYNFPFTIMVLFKIKPVKEVGVSFMPKLTDLILTEENAKLFGRKVGDKIYLDTAWELPYKLKSAGYDGTALPIISPRLDKEKIFFMTEDMRGEEHQLDGIPIFTHVGRSSTRDFFKDPIVIKWRNRVIEWLETKK